MSVASIAAPPDVIAAFHHGFALSPDGASLAFTARNAAGRRQVWVRRLDELTARPLDGTDGALYPFWSPDGANLGFFAGVEMRRVPATGGSVQTIGRAPGIEKRGASWGDGGQILFSNEDSNGNHIFKVDAAGGEVSRLDLVGRAPRWLPGGREFLFSAVVNGAAVLQVASIEGGPPRTVTELFNRRLAASGISADNGSAVTASHFGSFAYAEPGHLFTNRGGALTVQPIDPRTVTPTGPPVAIAGEGGSPSNWFSVSAAGDRLVAVVADEAGLVGMPGDPMARLTWVDRQGSTTGELGEPGRYWTMRLAPDGRRAAVNVEESIWILGTGMRPGKSRDEGYAAVWSPDGSEYVMQSPGGWRRKRADSDAPAMPLEGAPFGFVTDWSPDGRTLLATSRATTDVTHTDLFTYDLASRSVRVVVTSPLVIAQGRFSPDGHRVAYTVRTPSGNEVYIRNIDSDGAAVPVGLGSHPSWRRDGRELFFLGANDELMAVEMTPGSSQPVSGPRQLFRTPLNDITRDGLWPYDVTPDGQRFLLNVPDTPRALLYIDGLQALLRTK